jgi:hypothetical protein
MQDTQPPMSAEIPSLPLLAGWLRRRASFRA